jgi:hypothetical protein
VRFALAWRTEPLKQVYPILCATKYDLFETVIGDYIAFIIRIKGLSGRSSCRAGFLLAVARNSSWLRMLR